MRHIALSLLLILIPTEPSIECGASLAVGALMRIPRDVPEFGYLRFQPITISQPMFPGMQQEEKPR